MKQAPVEYLVFPKDNRHYIVECYWSSSFATVGGDIAHGDWYRKSRDLVVRHFRYSSYIVWNVFQTFLC